jgi:hypothetical protein
MSINVVNRIGLARLETEFPSSFRDGCLSVNEYRIQEAPVLRFNMVKPVTSMCIAKSRNGNQYVGFGLIPEAKHIPGGFFVQTEIVFVLDRSVSMTGDRFDLAKEALQNLIDLMTDETFFNVIVFDRAFECFMEETVPATDDWKSEAKQWLADCEIGGGTQLLPPLKHIYDTPPRDGYVRQIFVLTDGETLGEEDIYKEVAEHRGKHHIFSIGIGEDLEGQGRGFIERMAATSGGTSVFVNEPEDIIEPAKKFLESSFSPSIVDVHVELEGGSAYSMVPNPFNALFMNSISYVFMRKAGYIQPGSKFDFHITGKNGDRDFNAHFVFNEPDTPIQLEKFYGDGLLTDVGDKMVKVTRVEREPVRMMMIEVSTDAQVPSIVTPLVAVATTPPKPVVPVAKVVVDAAKPAEPDRGSSVKAVGGTPTPAPPPEPRSEPEPELVQDFTPEMLRELLTFEAAQTRESDVKREVLSIGGLTVYESVMESKVAKNFDRLTVDGQIIELKLDMSHLNESTLFWAMRKIGRLIDILKRKKLLDERVQELEKIETGGDVFPTKRPIALKLFDVGKHQAKFLEVSSSDGVDKLKAKIKKVLRRTRTLFVKLAGEESELTAVTLRQAHIMIWTEHSSAVVIRAKKSN